MTVVVGFDYGEQRVGIAVGNSLTGLGQPLKALKSPGSDEDWAAILGIIAHWQPQELIVGIPLNMDGSRQPITRKARRFAHELRTRAGLPVHPVDERLSSVAAQDALRDSRASGARPRRLRAGDIDAAAATVLVEQWLAQDHDAR